MLFLLLFAACKKQERITTDPSAKLDFSANSISFDTVFTSKVSTIRRVKVYNRQKNALEISEIKLAGGKNSPFSAIVNGNDARLINNLKIDGQDSLNIIIQVFAPSTIQKQAFLLQDSLLFRVNGNKQVITLNAYAQNAIFVTENSINSNTNWTNDLPYIIEGLVNISDGITLTIVPGAKIYFRKDAGLQVNGKLLACGTKENPINFCSDRLEQIYSEEPGQWKGLSIGESGQATLSYTRIKNALVGITAASCKNNMPAKVLLTHSLIKNMSVSAFVGYQSSLAAFNNLFYNCGSSLISISGGGNYQLKQNTLANLTYKQARQNPAFIVNKSDDSLKLVLTNNIIWGNLTNEISIKQKDASKIDIGYNLLKTTAKDFFNTSNIFNIDPEFIDSNNGYYALNNNSVAHQKGIDLSADPYFNLYLKKDFNDKLRFFPSSLGCYEKK